MPKYNKKILGSPFALNHYFLVSGGRDSTAMVLLAHEQGIKGVLIFGNTGLNRKPVFKTLKKLQDYTKWPLYEVKYQGEKKPIEILRESFMMIPKAIQQQKKAGAYRRDTFNCCHLLKHKPMNDFIKSLNDPGACLVLGIKGYDGAINRIYRMRQIRERNTFYRRHVKTGLLYFYPLRDMRDSDIDEILTGHGFQDTESSGCSICPIFCLFENWRKKDPDTWRRSVQFADRLGVQHPAQGQQFFTRLCNNA